MTYAQKLKDPRWQKRRLQMLEARGWRCEQCRDDKATLHVHHLRYRGEPWEAMDHDLRVLCERCHDIAHGKQPSIKEFAVYCAGKIGRMDWRHGIFDELHDVYAAPSVREVAGARFRYSGPWFAESEHGLAHGDGTHGRADGQQASELAERMQSRVDVKRQCFDWMAKSDCLFAYIDSPGAYGSCVEIAWWRATKRKRLNDCGVLFATQELLEEYWFLPAYVYSDTQNFENLIYPDASEAFSDFCDYFLERNR
jgi:hypothetical protein